MCEMSHPNEEGVGEGVPHLITSPPEKYGLLSRHWRDVRRDRALT